MNVLSLFDGMSCGRIALERAGVSVNNYYASEIDKYAIAVSKKNYPDIKHIGDVTQVRASDLPQIDLLIGGSPCQGFSFAGKQLNFDDPRSKLFFEFVRLLKETKPKYFLLENVRMKQEYQDIISQHLGVQPIKINSALVSAQNRVRLYWTNIPNVNQPEDKGIFLKDIIESVVSDEFNSGAQKFGGKYKNMLNTAYKSQANTIHDKDGKAPTICAGTHGYALGHIQATTIAFVDRDKSHCLDANYYKGDNLKSYFEKHRRQLVFSKDGGSQPKIVQKPHGYNKGGLKEDKSPSMTTSSWQHNNHLTHDDGLSYRKLTPVECERLQTVPDNYTDGVSNTQRYKMLGNGWTVDVISHIFLGV